MLQMHQTQKVLIVDDERTITNTLATIFCNKGYDTRGVYSAEEARALILDWSPDLAIIDVLLPQMNGIEFAILLRAEFPECRLVLFSGHTQTADLLDFAKGRGHRFAIVPKPIHPEELLNWAADSTRSQDQSSNNSPAGLESN
jgi:DNA-binding NtrC family response regulator